MAGVRVQGLVAAPCAAAAAYVSVRLLDRFFPTRDRLRFAGYCRLAGAASIIGLE